jgi:glyoxylase I family protein
MKCRGLHHAGIVVPDLDKAIVFYSALTGFEKIRETSWSSDNTRFNQVVGLKNSAARLCLLQGTNCHLELFEYSTPVSDASTENHAANDHGIRHLCFEVDDVAAALNLVLDFGGSKINDPVSSDSGITAVYCRDPFGNLLELITPVPGGPLPSIRSITRGL